MRPRIDELPAVSVSETLSLKRGIVDLWYLFPESIGTLELNRVRDVLMSSDERKRCEAFRFERDRLLFIVSRVAVRMVLSRYAPAAPAAWVFTADQHGKPRVVSPDHSPRLHFNLTNTRGLVVCAVSVAHDAVGVDAELVDAARPTHWLANRAFSPSEVQLLDAMPPAEQAQGFFEYWTLKESYTKARGLGLSMPLDQFSFKIDDYGISATFGERVGDDPAAWRFSLLTTSQCHSIAISAKTGGAELSLRATDVMHFVT